MWNLLTQTLYDPMASDKKGQVISLVTYQLSVVSWVLHYLLCIQTLGPENSAASHKFEMALTTR